MMSFMSRAGGSVRIAEALGVTRGAVSQWLKLLREYGIDALRYKKVSKKPVRLSQSQWVELVTMLGVCYHLNSVGKILKACGWTYQKPVLRASQRNDEAVRQWCADERWPELKKTAEEDRTRVFADESGFYLLPFASRTFAPKKETSVLRHKLSHKHLSVISCITEQGRLIYM